MSETMDKTMDKTTSDTTEKSSPDGKDSFEHDGSGAYGLVVLVSFVLIPLLAYAATFALPHLTSLAARQHVDAPAFSAFFVRLQPIRIWAFGALLPGVLILALAPWKHRPGSVALSGFLLVAALVFLLLAQLGCILLLRQAAAGLAS